MNNVCLKSVEIQGFKSFPEKTHLKLEKPITGIIGPNGSGKSNISDAILWVMGEQSSRSLRGGKMEDVIFGGTQRRSQVGFAEVSLILDNTDRRFAPENSEIMITRRYYRSGESEYYINKSLVRLRDVDELFMDTGLGREGYSIIGQGRIADILSTKSKDRRDIFEEAAGISRHRHRKEDAERKIQQTDENLLRIGDKISELDLQIEPLREQAEIARKYLLLRDELRGLEISVWLRELEALRLSAEKADSDHTAAKLNLETISRQFEDGFKESEELSDSMRQCDIEADALREKISQEEVSQSELESSAAVLRSQLEGNITQIERLNLDLQNQENRQSNVGAHISERRERLVEIEVALSSHNDSSSALISELNGISGQSGESSKELADLVNAENETNIELGNQKSSLSALASQAQELYDIENSVKLELAEAADKLAMQASDQKRCLEELKRIKEEVETHTNIIDGLALKARNRTEKASSAGEKSERLKHELQTLESRKNLLADMEKDYQGYSKAVKLVMQEHLRGAVKNVHGTVASLIRTGDRYTVAIETALGGAMQHIIVDTEEDGKAAINLLKRRDGGRATFLPISTISGNSLSEKEVGGDEGFVGIGLDLIEFDPKYGGIYANLLGRVIIVDNINSAIRIAGRHKFRYKVVTLDGQVMNTGGSMTGGSSVSSSGVLSRANELEQLAGRIEALSVEAAKAGRELSECIREKNASEYELEIARSELREIEDKLIWIQSEEQHSALLLQKIKEDITAYENEATSVNKRIVNNTEETKKTKAGIALLETRVESLKESIEETVRGRERLSQERDRINALLSELLAGRASLDAEKEALEKTVIELSALSDEMSGNRGRQLEAIEGLKTRNEEIHSELVENEKNVAAITQQIDEYRSRLEETKTKKLDYEAKRSSLNKDIQGKNQEMLDMERECSRLEQKKLAAQMEERQIVDKLWDTYELSRSAALSSAKPIEKMAEAQRRISAIKRSIQELGNPNIGAIDEFTRVNNRYTFLTSQRDDVEKAKTDLLGLISDIEKHMREVFMREFAVINENFEKIFKELFGGGHASLLLEDPGDVLNCGIEIQAQPPGKSLKALTPLSGGEKALVAIAIYFAILAVRPPPFIVMDEIETALDDANVLRFSSYMRRMSNNTQMIVISHKRATMEEVDVLYGVTMQELGVSSILKVDLDEWELAHK